VAAGGLSRFQFLSERDLRYTSVMRLSRSPSDLFDVPADRVVLRPAPGTATVADVVRAGKPVCELIDGTLIRTAVGFSEAVLSACLTAHVIPWVRRSNLGIVTSTSAPCEILPGVVRTADLSFTPWSRLPGGRLPQEPIPRVVPELAAWILRKDNTRAEMARKRGEYFRAGVRLVWEIDPRKRGVRVYATADQFTELSAGDTLDGGAVLPGFTLPLADLFAELDRHG
jgi:Uma2 family endonuclease